MIRSLSRLRWRVAFGVVAAAVALGCRDTLTGPKLAPAPTGQLAIFASAGSNAVSTLVIDVTGSGIVKSDGTTPDTLVFNFTLTNGVASGSISIPSGPQRTIVAHAYNGQTETHRGSVTTDIAAGTNPQITITLIPLASAVPITLTLGTTLILITPDSIVKDVGDTVRMSAQIRDQNGNVVSGTVHWASLNTQRATVDTLGLVTVRDTGYVEIVGTIGTSGGRARIYGTNHATSVAYVLTWNGATSTSWTDSTNWTNHGSSAPRSPTASDSVIISAAASRFPIINTCTNVNVRDLVVEAGTSIGSAYCVSDSHYYGIAVYHSAVVRGNVAADIRMLRATTVAGLFSHLYVQGDSVALSDTVVATGVDVIGAGSTLRLAGHHMAVNNASFPYGTVTLTNGSRIILNGGQLYVASSLTMNDSSWVEMTNAADTLNVRGAFTVGTHNTKTGNLLSAGVLRVGGNFYAAGASSFAPGTSHSTYFDGKVSTYQYIEIDSTALNGGSWSNVHLSGASYVEWSYASCVNDGITLLNFSIDSISSVQFYSGCGKRFTITPATGTLTARNELSIGGLTTINGNLTLTTQASPNSGDPTPGVPKIDGGGNLVLTGNLTTPSTDSVTVYNLTFQGNGTSGTANVAGYFSPTYLNFTNQAAPTLATGLAYQNLTLSQGSSLVVPSGTLRFSANLTMNDSSYVKMTAAAETLSVRGSFSAGTRDSRTLLTAGVLRIGGNITASSPFSFAPATSVVTYLDGKVSNSQYIQVDSVALNAGQWYNLHLAGAGYVYWSYATCNNDGVTLQNFSIDSIASVQFSSPCGKHYTINPSTGTLTARNEFYVGGTTLINGGLTLTTRQTGNTGDPTPGTPKIDGNGNLILTGNLTTPSTDSVTVYQLTFQGNGTSGTANVAGYFSPSYLNFTNQAAPTLATGLAYQNLTLSQGSSLVVPSGTLRFSGNLTMNDSSYVKMTAGAETLSVRGSYQTGTRDSRTLLTAGVLRLGGNIIASSPHSFAPGTSFLTYLDGKVSTTQYIEVDSVALNAGQWYNLHLAGASAVYWNYATCNNDGVTLQNFSIDSISPMQFQSPCGKHYTINPSTGTLTARNEFYVAGTTLINGGLTLTTRQTPNLGDPTPGTPKIDGGGNLILTGNLTVPSNDSVTVYNLTFQGTGTSGTSNVTGYFSPPYLNFTNQAAPTLQPGLAYQNLTMSQGSSLVVPSGPVALVFSGNLTMNDSSYVKMTVATDTLSVRGSYQAGTKDSRTLLTNGVLRIGGNITASNAFSFAPSSSFVTYVDGKVNTYQYIQVDSLALNGGQWYNVHLSGASTVYWNYATCTTDGVTLQSFSIDSISPVQFQSPCGKHYTINPAGGTLTARNEFYVAGTTLINGALTLTTRQSPNPGDPTPGTPKIDGGGNLTVTGALTIPSSDTVNISNLTLQDTSGTSNVAGYFTPSTLYLTGTGAGQTIKAGLAYRSLVLSGIANFGSGTYNFLGNSSVTSSGVMNVSGGVTVSFYGGSGFYNLAFANGSQINFSGSGGLVLYGTVTNSAGVTTTGTGTLRAGP